MLRNAENVIRLLENPGGNVEQQTPTDETVEDEMTPVIEARLVAVTLLGVYLKRTDNIQYICLCDCSCPT